ncbi:hypothetical protein E9232_000921 [Inquilinus ginsengisoli]|uniref:Ig-like domain-containing protein n=1 Tax=Inquilinus ginsengisoli TaxID=363840 RepID=A0ABU1JIH5_9PROT|nr:hypothetical protein [Inquilinus ginsengisoli]MDR6288414.1 hypothetical protein [Inquilinus ginsengisoli]
MNKPQTAQAPEAPAAPQEERAARHLRLLARAAEIQMEVMEATRAEAVKTPQPGVDYCQRIATVTRSLRLTLLLEDKLSRPPEEGKTRSAEPAGGASPRLRALMAVAAANYHGVETEAQEMKARSRFGDIRDLFERPDVVEMVETCPAPAVVARLCRGLGLPEDTRNWLAVGDMTLEELGFAPPEEAAPDPAGLLDPVAIRRRLRVIMALSAAIKAGAKDAAEWERRFAEMTRQMDRPELMAIAETRPAAEAVALICPTFGLPPEQAERWVAEGDRSLAEMDLPPVEDDRREPGSTGVERRKPPDTG